MKGIAIMESADYIIIGAGSAGCVLANRLSVDTKNHVLLLEAGGLDNHIWIHIPVGYFKTMHNPRYDWCYLTEADESVGGRRIQWPRGKVLGGSSSLNGLLYVRGQPEDYDHWAALGNTGWSFAEVLPYFKKSEDQAHGGNAFHGVGGPLKVSDPRIHRPVADRFIAAATEIGIPFNDDCNGARQEGAGYFQQTASKGFRCSTAKAFLRPARKRTNLSTITNAMVTRILFEGKRAIGVEYRHAGKIHQARAGKEVILSGGTVGSPKILQLSGVGPSALLDKVGIPVLQDLPGVGKNLQDHLQIRLVYATRSKTMNDEVNSLFSRVRMGLQYMLSRTGPLTMAASQVYIFTRSNPSVVQPDIQFHMQPLSADEPGAGAHPFSAFTSSVCQLRPYSRGEIAIQSSDPTRHPLIRANYLHDERDQRVAVDAIKVARRIAQAPSLAKEIVSEFTPGPQYQSDDELLQAARLNSQSIYHPVGTCKMGTDPMAVVDSRLRVHGLNGLRVVDASIMPDIVSGNTNAPTIMIAEKASDMILADHR